MKPIAFPLRNIRIVSTFVFFVSLLIACQGEKENIDDIKNRLIELEKKSWAAWQNHDGNFYDQFLSIDHKEIGADGVSGKTEVVDFVGSGLCKVSSYSTDQFSFSMIDENVAFLTYHAAQETICNNKVPSPVWVTSVYVKRNGQWQNIVYQQTVARK